MAGKVKLARHAPDGRENLLTVMGPSDMFGELSIFDEFLCIMLGDHILHWRRIDANTYLLAGMQ